MVLLVPKLSEATISKDLLKHFAILQQDELSSIRTNTTICLGKVACHFSEAVSSFIEVESTNEYIT